MRSLPHILIVLFLLTIISCNSSDETSIIEDQVLELDDFDYFEDDIPYQATRYQINPNHDKIAALGRILFYDPSLSLNNSISCSSCHQQQSAFSDNKVFSPGIRGFETTRNSMALANNAYQISHFWEGGVGVIEDFVLNPVSNHIEMGMRSIDDLVAKLSENKEYNKLFNEVHNAPISEELIAISISTFVASIISHNSKFDKGQDLNFANFSAGELAGKDLFFGKAKCGNCHKGYHFTATWRRYANIGLDMNLSLIHI